MNDPASRPPPGLLARTLKLVGRLTSPETRTGKLFTKAEGGLTRVAARLAESPTYLRVSGALLNRGLSLQVRRHAALEERLRALRIPTASEVDSMRNQLRRMGDQVEALSSQLEHVVHLLERQESKPPPTEQPRPRASRKASTRA
jgi:hypothetical protein